VPEDRPNWLDQIEGVLESLHQGVIVTDDCRRILFANQVFLDMIELSPAELLGRDSLDFFPPEDAALLREHIERGQRQGHNRFEFYVPRRSGGRLPVVNSARGIEDPDGRYFAIVTFTDISEQKLAESRLREANAKLEARQREIEEDLTLAARVQQSLAPKSLHWGDISVEAFYQPVRTIGGDFGLVAPGRHADLNLLVCDVSGHGIGSALVANRIYSETLSQFEAGAGLGALLRQLNHFVIQNLASSVFYFTLAVARLDRSGRRLEFAGAGHPPAMVVRSGEPARMLESRSSALGFFEDAVAREAAVEVPLRSGDRVFLYTDGLTEVFNASRDMLGVSGLSAIASEAAALPLPDLKQPILDRVAAWRAGPPIDDVSMVLAEVP